MRAAFKEWAIVVDALGRGEQIFIFRKGGIHEGRGGFRTEHSEFFLFPTQFHQQREAVVPAAQERFDQIADRFREDRVCIEYFARVSEWHFLEDVEGMRCLRGQHVWRDDLIAERFAWGKTKGLFTIAVKVFKLPQPVNLPNLPEYGGCRSWIALAQDITTDGATPVLDDDQFGLRLKMFRSALGAELESSPR